ncbi:MAG: F0F1 ATP synthase subunit gamma [Blastocatellales bacterium]
MSLEQTQQGKQAVEAVHDIVSAMRAIAAGRIQSAQRALVQARRYQELVMQSLAALPSAAKSLPLPQSDGGRVMLMVLTSEQPFCGGFNQQVLTLAEKRWREYRAAGQIHLFAVGQRGVAQMMARGIMPDESVQATTSMQGMRNLVRRLVKLVDERYVTGEMAELRVIYNRYQSVSEQVPTEEKLLPFDWSRVAESAIPDGGELDRYLELPELLAGLIGEYVFINLYRIAAESFTSEQANRLLAMDGATRNTEKMIQSLAELERRQRQELITRQVLELIAARFAAD